MKKILLFVPLILLLNIKTVVNATPVRHELATKEETLIYYVEQPEQVETYPIVLAIEGSYVANSGPTSVLRLHECLSPEILSWGASLITLERRGTDGENIDSNTYHYYNIPSQRLSDHLTLVAHIRENPPVGWNKKLIILGGSEGGPIAINLAQKTNPDACVAIVGCGDQTFKEYIWKFLKSMRACLPWWRRIIFCWWASVPTSRASYEARCKKMKKNPDHNKWWFGQTFKYWADALDQCEADNFLALTCPCFVVAGSKDIECESTDRIVKIAKDNGNDVTYMRVEGMCHGALDPQWGVLEGLREFLQAKQLIR